MYIVLFLLIWPVYALLVLTDRRASPLAKAGFWIPLFVMIGAVALVIVGLLGRGPVPTQIAQSLPDSIEATASSPTNRVTTPRPLQVATLPVCDCALGSEESIQASSIGSSICVSGTARHLGTDSFTLVFSDSGNDSAYVRMPIWSIDFSEGTVVRVSGIVQADENGRHLIEIEQEGSVWDCQLSRLGSGIIGIGATLQACNADPNCQLVTSEPP
jgi:hypothetical protein